jgi:hypothetical protein
MRLACFDPVLPPYVVRLTIHGSMIRLNLEQARELQDQLRSAIIDATLEEIPPTDPAPAVEPVTRSVALAAEPVTRPGTAEARKRSEPSMRAVTDDLRRELEKAKGSG